MKDSGTVSLKIANSDIEAICGQVFVFQKPATSLMAGFARQWQIKGFSHTPTGPIVGGGGPAFSGAGPSLSTSTPLAIISETSSLGRCLTIHFHRKNGPHLCHRRPLALEEEGQEVFLLRQEKEFRLPPQL